jgi:hypothetical protein
MQANLSHYDKLMPISGPMMHTRGTIVAPLCGAQPECLESLCRNTTVMPSLRMHICTDKFLFAIPLVEIDEWYCPLVEKTGLISIRQPLLSTPVVAQVLIAPRV